MNRVKSLGLTGWGTVAAIVGSIAAVAALFVGGGDSSSAPAPAPQKEENLTKTAQGIIEDFHAGSYEAMWQEFHPAVKERIPLDFYLECEESRGVPAGITDAKHASTGAVTVDMEGVPSTISVVRFDIAFADGVKDIEDVWLANDENGISYVPFDWEYADYVQGECPPPVKPGDAIEDESNAPDLVNPGVDNTGA